ncbi:tubby-like F-box protein 7 [Punica granatum]|uniref:Tubby-like F-box protein n=1 Tax=Punica granatum TaxID=22663 RepID=A0A218XVC0_PUNGR|nr:tubby-like F-box protein 7 [Punica granatum]OWM88586.1 hypothetical protein CDL15_Pgr002353 [Punica granatum]
MSLGRKFLSRKFSKSFRELGRALREEGAAGEEEDRASSLPGGDMARVESAAAYGQSWGTMLPELLGEIIRRVEVSEDRWPQRQNVVACACVCKRWREITKEIVRAPLNSDKITFPSCLKQPGPRDFSHQCLIKRNSKNSTFYLYLALTPSFTDKGKFLLAARRYRHGAHIEYIISHDADDLSQGSNAYVGKLSSDFLGTNFTIYDSQPPHSGARPSSNRASRRFASKQISPQVPAGNFEVGHITYKFNLLKSRGPRRMVCSLKCSSSPRGEASPALEKETDQHSYSKTKKLGSGSASSDPGTTILRNKAPRWHEHLQCWCLNFHGRVTVASVKNFQLVATVDQSQPGGKGDEETVLLQFGKVSKDTFTMDFRQPLSAFQAFAICLTSFGTKIACE